MKRQPVKGVQAFSSKYQPVSHYRETGFFILNKEVRG
jgi:hypothetical protein